MKEQIRKQAEQKAEDIDSCVVLNSSTIARNHFHASVWLHT